MDLGLVLYSTQLCKFGRHIYLHMDVFIRLIRNKCVLLINGLKQFALR